MKKITDIMKKARDLGIALPAFNVPYLQMIETNCKCCFR